MAPHRHQHRQLCVRGLIDGQVFLGAILTSVWPARFYYQGAVGNEVGASDPAFMGKHAQELEKDSGKWIDHSVWHGKAHTWDKVKWVVNEVCLTRGPPSCGRTEPWMQWKKISGGRPFVLKGIQSAADAQLALDAGCEGIVVTNHAGRQVDGAVGSLEVLPEIVAAVGDSTFFPSPPLPPPLSPLPSPRLPLITHPPQR